MADDENDKGDTLPKSTAEILANLTPREAKALRERFGIDMSQTHTLEEIREQFEVTRNRIRGIETKALGKLRSKKKQRKSETTCSFCGEYESEEKRLVKADSGVTICNDCLNICADIINENEDE